MDRMYGMKKRLNSVYGSLKSGHYLNAIGRVGINVDTEVTRRVDYSLRNRVHENVRLNSLIRLILGRSWGRS